MIRSTAEANCDRSARIGSSRPGHADHGFETAEGVARGVGVDGRHLAFVAGVHGLDHVERFRAATLADDDPVGPHTKGVFDEVGRGDRASAFDVRRAGFQPDDVILLELEFGGVLDRDDPMVGSE